LVNLKNVTLIGMDGVGGDKETAIAMKYSQRNIDFGKTILFSASNDQYDFCDTVNIKKMTYDECQKFTLTELVSYIETDYMLLVQGDGFVVNPELWNSSFLHYDYIGAPWPYSNVFENSKRWPDVHAKMIQSNKNYQVGNGGFTLRSKKLMDNITNLYDEKWGGIPEDAVICIGMRSDLETVGCKWPPICVAASFSCEARLVDVDGVTKIFSSDQSFGFHCRGTHPDKIELLVGEN
jgi:hypothetical protein